MFLAIPSAYILAAILYAVTGALTHFKPRDSTVVQRVFTMGWVIVGTVLGGIIPLFFLMLRQPGALYLLVKPLVELIIVLILLGVVVYSGFAIGGMVIVGQMLVE
jgi:hypothetical protein